METTKEMPKYMTQGSARGCSIDGCPGNHAAQGYCMRHYSRIVRRKQADVESPSDNNPNGDDPMTEDEYCRFKDWRSQGFSKRDIAFELQKNIQVIVDAWETECYAQYLRGPEKAWPTIDKL